MAGWKKEDRKYIQEHYGEMTAEEIAEELGRSVSAVRTYITRSGIRKKRKIPEPPDKFSAGDSLCWRCRRATNPEGNTCSWSKEFLPVENWEAEKTKVITARGKEDSYHVKGCPLFSWDGKTAGDSDENAFRDYIQFVDSFVRKFLQTAGEQRRGKHERFINTDYD